MPNAAIVAAALTNHANHPFGLYVNGVDVIQQPTVPATYAVPLDSILIEDMGPDGVSSMEFTIECSTVLPVSVPDGAEVRFESLNASPSYVLFRGWVDHVDYQNMDGSVGTRFVVRCTGIEAALDWLVFPADVTIPAGVDLGAAVQSLYGQATGSVSLNVAGAASSVTGTPVQTAWSGPGVLNATLISAGTTLREAIREVVAQTFAGSSTIFATVDFFGGLRFYAGTVGDLSTRTIDDDPPVSSPAEDLSYGIDASQYRGVVVKGTGVTVTVGDGTGKAGPMAVLTDSTLTTVAAATAAGQAYLTQYASTARGQFGLSDMAMVNTDHAFQLSVAITDARVGLSATVFRVTSIAWRPYIKSAGGSLGGICTISFGGNPPSVTALTRQLTRTTLS